MSRHAVRLRAYCLQCNRKHWVEYDPLAPDNQRQDWYLKHLGHVGVGFDWPGRSAKPGWVGLASRFWRLVRMRPAPGALAGGQTAPPGGVFGADFSPPGLGAEYRPPLATALAAALDNADVKVTYAATATPTLTLASLGASSSLLAGRESGSVTNASNKYLDHALAGNYRAGAANNQAGTIKTCVVGPRDDTPTWPDVLDGTDSTETITDQPTFDSICRVVSSISADATASQTWHWGPVSLVSHFGGLPPVQWVYFVTQNIHTSTNVWSATEGDHAVRHTGVYLTVA